jgi:LacI family transcriptional regulator
MPVVLLDNYLPGTPVAAVVNDNRGGAYSGTRHLAELGHTRIGFVGAAVDYPFGRETHDGYRRALADAGLPADPALEVIVPIDAERAREGAGRLLSLADPPSAIFAVTDMLALGVTAAARERGLVIPADLSVVGMDDIDQAAVTNPPLTTVRIAKEEMGRRAAWMLLDLIRGDDVDPGLVVLPTELVVRGTAGGRR